MTKLEFNAADVRRVVEHSLKAPKQRDRVTGYDKKTHHLTYSQPEAPAVLLVHDDGVYLMSNGVPRDLVQANGHERSYTAHAKGCDPNKDAGCWETSRALVGGDDFSECLPWAQEMKDRLDRGAKRIVLYMSNKGIRLGS